MSQVKTKVSSDSNVILILKSWSLKVLSLSDSLLISGLQKNVRKIQVISGYTFSR